MNSYKNYEVISNKNIAKDVFELKVKNNNDNIKAGQFYMIKVDGKFLPRPISVCDSNDDSITFVYKTFGEGTKILSESFDTLSMLGPLGNGWEKVSNKNIVLVAGGVGTPAIYKLAKELSCDNDINVILGFRSKEDVFYEEAFKEIASVSVVTDDGSYGLKGSVIDVLNKIDFDYLYSCGPNGMLKAIASTISCDGQVSLEEHMACGIGICGGCPGSILKKQKDKKVCKDGPVFPIGSIDV